LIRRRDRGVSLAGQATWRGRLCVQRKFICQIWKDQRPSGRSQIHDRADLGAFRQVGVVGQVDGLEGRNNLIAVRQLLNPPDQSGNYHPAHRPQ
jgi:hypothetical protein